MITCSKCHEPKPATAFYPNRHGNRDSTCKPCRNAERRENHQRKRNRAIKRTCQGCGRTQPITCYPLPQGAVKRSAWCLGCTRAVEQRRHASPEHWRYLASSARIVRTEEERQAWVAEGAEMLRANTDAVRPAGGAE
jgi:hypothetical protein